MILRFLRRENNGDDTIDYYDYSLHLSNGDTDKFFQEKPAEIGDHDSFFK